MAGASSIGSLELWYMALNSSNANARQPAAAEKSTPAPQAAAETAQHENDALFRTIISTLKAAGIEFSLLHHEPTRTSAESAAVRGVTLDSGAKAMLVALPTAAGKSDEYALLVLSASRKLDWKALRKALGRKTQLATQEAVHALTGCVPGAVPPFGSLFAHVSPGAAVRTVLDPSLQAQGATMNFNAGLRTASVGMSIADYIALEQPTVLCFSK